MATLLRRGFQDEGYAVNVAPRGPDAVLLGTADDYDGIVMDVKLPGCDGIEVCRQLRAAGRWAPIIMLTVRNAVEDRVAALDAGADDYLAKPFSFSELSARMRALIRRGALERHGRLRVGDLRVDVVARRAWRGQLEVRLSPLEFALLELFMRHPGVVLTRSRLLDHAWGRRTEHASNVVDQYVAYLRRKVGAKAIETVRRSGYRLRDPASA